MEQVAQLSQRLVSYGQAWKTVTERQYITDIIGLSTTVTYLASYIIEFGEKTQNKGYYAAQSHSRSSSWYQSKARMRLLISD